MKSVVLFYVVIAILNTVHCAEMSISDMENPKIDDEILKVIQHLFCNEENQVDIASILTNQEIMMRFPDKSIHDIQQLYCFDESTTVAMQVTNADANTDTSPSSDQLTITLPGITTDSTPSVATETFCRLPFIDPKNCDPACFLRIKLDVNECIRNYSRQYFSLSLKLLDD